MTRHSEKARPGRITIRPQTREYWRATITGAERAVLPGLERQYWLRLLLARSASQRVTAQNP